MINTPEELKERQRWLTDLFLECRQVEGFQKALNEDKFDTYKSTYETVNKPEVFNQVIQELHGREEKAQRWCFRVKRLIDELEEYRDRHNLKTEKDDSK